MGSIRFVLREFTPEDVQGVSSLICRNLREINCHDYPPQIIEQLVQEHTPERILRMSTEGKTFLADVAGNPAGILRVLPSWNVSAEYWLRTVFVLPDYHGCGIGRQLVEAGERFIQQQGGHSVRLCASRTAHLFYQRLGYCDLEKFPDREGLYPMQKLL